MTPCAVDLFDCSSFNDSVGIALQPDLRDRLYQNKNVTGLEVRPGGGRKKIRPWLHKVPHTSDVANRRNWPRWLLVVSTATCNKYASW